MTSPVPSTPIIVAIALLGVAVLCIVGFLIYKLIQMLRKDDKPSLMTNDDGTTTRRLTIENGNIISLPHTPPTRKFSLYPTSIYSTITRVASISQPGRSLSGSRPAYRDRRLASKDLENEYDLLIKARSKDEWLEKGTQGMLTSPPRSATLPHTKTEHMLQRRPKSPFQFDWTLSEALQRAYDGPQFLGKGARLVVPKRAAERLSTILPLSRKGSEKTSKKSSAEKLSSGSPGPDLNCQIINMYSTLPCPKPAYLAEKEIEIEKQLKHMDHKGPTANPSERQKSKSSRSTRYSNATTLTMNAYYPASTSEHPMPVGQDWAQHTQHRKSRAPSIAPSIEVKSMRPRLVTIPSRSCNSLRSEASRQASVPVRRASAQGARQKDKALPLPPLPSNLGSFANEIMNSPKVFEKT
ncbi:hypothetical protein MMC09_000756 [Bachmanniomyces sp. S44760]|nr:hypothetical protein [Bachmanniomyces sp. S44760]